MIILHDRLRVVSAVRVVHTRHVEAAFQQYIANGASQSGCLRTVENLDAGVLPLEVRVEEHLSDQLCDRRAIRQQNVSATRGQRWRSHGQINSLDDNLRRVDGPGYVPQAQNLAWRHIRFELIAQYTEQRGQLCD